MFIYIGYTIYGIKMSKRMCWNGYGPGFGQGSAGFGAGFGPHGPWAGSPQGGYAAFPGLGWAIYSALSDGAKTDKEVIDWITSKLSSQINADIIGPILQLWAAKGIIKRDSDNKYSLTMI